MLFPLKKYCDKYCSLQQQCYEQSSCPLIWDKIEQILGVEYSTDVKKKAAAP